MAYLITNENLSAYNDIYHFTGKDILSVVGSGDQYFTCKLHGAKRVDLFDCDNTAWNLFVLKFMALKNLDYPEFFRFIIEEEMKNDEMYERLRIILPVDVRDFFDLFYDYFYPCIDYYKGPKYGDGSIVPYFNEANYYKLKDILNQEELPTFYHKNIVDLPGEVKGPYDIMMASNIYRWLVNDYKIGNPREFKDLLDKFPVEVIQANYDWERDDDFVEAGYKETVIPSVDERFEHNYVYTYTRKEIEIPKIIGV
jgi:hypothetical protein